MCFVPGLFGGKGLANELGVSRAVPEVFSVYVSDREASVGQTSGSTLAG